MSLCYCPSHHRGSCFPDFAPDGGFVWVKDKQIPPTGSESVSNLRCTKAAGKIFLFILSHSCTDTHTWSACVWQLSTYFGKWIISGALTVYRNTPAQFGPDQSDWNATFHSAASWVTAGDSNWSVTVFGLMIFYLNLHCYGLLWIWLGAKITLKMIHVWVKSTTLKLARFDRCWVPAACRDTKPSQSQLQAGRLDSRSRPPKRGRDFNQIRKQPQQSEAFTCENEITRLNQIICLTQRHWLFLLSYRNWHSLYLPAVQKRTSDTWRQTR